MIRECIFWVGTTLCFLGICAAMAAVETAGYGLLMLVIGMTMVAITVWLGRPDPSKGQME